MSALCAMLPAQHTRAADSELATFHDWIRSLTSTSHLTFDAVNMLIDRQFLIRHNSPCTRCNRELRLVNVARQRDGIVWQCSGTGHHQTIALSVGSFFFKRKQSIIEWFLIIRMLEMKHSFTQIADALTHDHHIIRNCWIALIERMELWLDTNVFDAEYVFGRWEQVEIDECCINWRAPKRDIDWSSDDTAGGSGDWIIGMISRDQHSMIIFAVDDRTADSLIEPIEDLIQPGATLLTDALSTYNALNTHYDHHDINKRVDGFAQRQSCDRHHSINIHVNRCEAMWSQFRNYARQRRINTAGDATYLCIEYMHKFYVHHFCDALKVEM